MATQWTDWKGGERPVDAQVKVACRLRSGYECVQEAGEFDWDHQDAESDIIAYKVPSP